MNSLEKSTLKSLLLVRFVNSDSKIKDEYEALFPKKARDKRDVNKLYSIVKKKEISKYYVNRFKR